MHIHKAKPNKEASGSKWPWAKSCYLKATLSNFIENINEEDDGIYHYALFGRININNISKAV